MTAEHATRTRASITSLKRVVIKIGSRSLINEDHSLDEAQLAGLVEQMAELRAAGREVICVSSGAVAAGLRDLGLSRRPRDLPSLQAAASIGQARLIELYRARFADHGLSIGQVLLTHADLRSRERHLNARNTFSRLMRSGIVPIVNENDTVAVDEIRVGDNDRLSALVALLARADGLILLTSVDGFMTGPPGDADTRVLDRVERITPEIRALAGDSDADLATGGMRTKLEAVEMVTRAGEHAVIANAREPGILKKLFSGESVGTRFDGRPMRLRGRQRWIAYFDRPQGALRLDEGASRAVRDHGASLLPIGITAVEGAFHRGSPVRLIDERGNEIGRGLVNYPAEDVARIRGLASERIADALGVCEYEEVVHRDNLVMTA